jgi:hypothetical protein
VTGGAAEPEPWGPAGVAPVGPVRHAARSGEAAVPVGALHARNASGAWWAA